MSNPITVTHDPVAEAAYIKVRDTEIVRTTEADPSVTIDFDSAGQVVGIEILDVSSVNQPTLDASEPVG